RCRGRGGLGRTVAGPGAVGAGQLVAGLDGLAQALVRSQKARQAHPGPCALPGAGSRARQLRQGARRVAGPIRSSFRNRAAVLFLLPGTGTGQPAAPDVDSSFVTPSGEVYEQQSSLCNWWYG